MEPMHTAADTPGGHNVGYVDNLIPHIRSRWYPLLTAPDGV